jgi:hypothetical protein
MRTNVGQVDHRLRIALGGSVKALAATGIVGRWEWARDRAGTDGASSFLPEVCSTWGELVSIVICRHGNTP